MPRVADPYSETKSNPGERTTQMHEAVGATDVVYDTEDIKLGTDTLKNLSKRDDEMTQM